MNQYVFQRAIKLNLFLVFTFLLALSSCSSLTQDLLKDPIVSINSLNITNVSLEDLALDLELKIDNPNSIPLNLNEITYALNISGEKISEGIFEKGIAIPANGTNSIAVPLKFKYHSLGKLFTSVLNNSLSNDYEFKGSAKIGIFNIPFRKTGQINIKK